ncbi:predicted protein [Streptomyces viridosporus ATCC 14672]|uniref:Predicted protein n=1 Tax=Streptomyces viridosporus (strain ATCC 14672 / DSM 40746 / JCM 4963 / KCTC 9882 / NRRL B-12104 / FH 1290) TaxID=566461 RepID=D6A5H1_STRV1|nr:predicted protein [Streptomyces viridosporus ATCC 14672]
MPILGHRAPAPCPVLPPAERPLLSPAPVEEREFIEPFLPIGEYAPYPERLRQQFEGVIRRFRTGGQRREAPTGFGAWSTVHHRFRPATSTDPRSDHRARDIRHPYHLSPGTPAPRPAVGAGGARPVPPPSPARRARRAA